jgi:hypothetical protein
MKRGQSANINRKTGIKKGGQQKGGCKSNHTHPLVLGEKICKEAGQFLEYNEMNE